VRQLPVRAALTGFVALSLTGVLVAVGVSGAGAPRPATQAASVDRPVAPPERASRTRTATAVASLRSLVTPDLLVRHDRALTASQVVALRRIRGVTAFAMLSTGSPRIGRSRVPTVGVDPSTFRAFTPRETASSDALWAAIARGDLAASYAARLPLGRTVTVLGRSRVDLRIGAVAAYGLPGADLVVNSVLGRELGLRATSMVLAAPDRSVEGLSRDVRAILGDAVGLQVLRPVAITYRRPATYRALYQLSARYCPGLSWTVLAAIGQVESGHGRHVGPSSAGALGPMQFMPATWAFARVDGDGDGRADIMSPYDAVPAAALYLCRNGAGRGGQDLYNAVFSYNHADWYVRKVLAFAAKYT
jgi:hypothetical protein